ncbi:MAG: hypothetical protein KTR23_18590 [Rhodospirillales bacterium]|nr:hypothetical protein [Rhodospirillales bacterium]
MRLHSRILLLSGLFFVMIFGWKVTALWDLSVLICLPVYLYALCKPRNLPKLISTSLWISATLIGLIAYEIWQFSRNDPSSMQWILRTIRSAISFGAVFIVVDKMRKDNNHNYTQQILLALAFAISAHAIIASISQISDNFRSVIYAMTSAAEYVNEITMAMDNRPLGLTYSLSLTSFLYFIAIAILITHQTTGKAGLIAVNVIACILTARTGIVFFPLLILLSYKKILRTNTKKLIFGSITAAVTIAATVNLSPWPLSTQYQRIHEIFVFLTTPSQSVFGQQFTTMWHIPNDWGQLLFGNSLTGREEEYYVASDVGYVLTIYGTGLIGLFLMLLPVLIAIFTSFKMLSSKSEYGLLALVILASYLVLNVKELALMTRTVWPVICVFISISLLEYQALRKRQNGDDTSQ